MKTLLICLYLLAIGFTQASAGLHLIVCDSEPGEIYFSGLHPLYIANTGFYYSADAGQNLELRGYVDPDSTSAFDFGTFLPDAADSTFSRFWTQGHYITTDGGFTWDLICLQLPLTGSYASGVISGEIYRDFEEPDYLLERSTNFGLNYSLCTTAGIPDTIPFIEDIALGADSGEVYVWAWQGLLYYSSSYADSFSFLGDLWSTWDIPPTSKILNGQQPGEIYAFWGNDSFVKFIWRIYDYGASVELMGSFPLNLAWLCSPAVSRTAGELYLLALDPDMVPGGTMRIYHTTNYGQDWIMYEHIVTWQGVEPQTGPLPASLCLNAWPNPANATLTISYDLPAPQMAILDIYNVLGQALWQYRNLNVTPGLHRISFSADQLPSGRYILSLQTPEGRVSRPFIVLK